MQQFSIVWVVVHQVRTLMLDLRIKVVYPHLLLLYCDRVNLETVEGVHLMFPLILCLWYIVFFSSGCRDAIVFCSHQLNVRPERPWLFSKSVADCMVIVSNLYQFSRFISSLTKMIPMCSILVFSFSTVEFISLRSLRLILRLIRGKCRLPWLNFHGAVVSTHVQAEYWTKSSVFEWSDGRCTSEV